MALNGKNWQKYPKFTLRKTCATSSPELMLYLEWFDWTLLAELTHVDLFVCWTRGEAVFRLPVNIQSWGWVECELLLAVPRGSVPDDRGSVHARAQYKVSCFVPLEREYWPLVLTQRLLLLASGGPDPRIPIITSRGQQIAVTIPVQTRHILVTGNLFTFHLDTVLQYFHWCFSSLIL